MSCPLPSINFGSFQKRINASGERIPLGGSMEVTARCNQFCSHCFINKPVNDSRELEKELSTEELLHVIDEISDAGCLFLLLTGGEPFVRADFLDVYKYAVSKGLLVTLFTNGTTIDRSVAKELSRWRPSSVEVTLYGMTKETYERVTGVKGSFEKCMTGIDLLMEYDIPLALKAMAIKSNKHEINAMKLFAEKRGVQFRFDPELNMGVDGRKSPESVRLSADEALEFDLADEKRSRGWEAFCDEFLGPQERAEYIYQCGAGIDSFHINAYGQMTPCLIVRSPAYNLREGTFRDGFYNFIPQVISRKRTKESKCVGCELIALCSQCPGVAYLETGDEEAPVESMCELAKLRASSFYKNNHNLKEREGNCSI